jgi:pimeloyl-ACP methyl ester carboxylesterase
MKNGYAPVNGAEIYYEIAGEGQPLVMLHAGIADCRMWDDQFSTFAEAYRVIRFDWRGYGKTAMVAGQYRKYEDVYGLLKFLEIDHAILMGCSIGGEACLDFTLEYPSMTDALILVGSWVSGFRSEAPPPPQEEAIQTAYKAGDLERCSVLSMEIWLSGIGRPLDTVDPVVRQRAHEMNMIWLKTPDGLGEELPVDSRAVGRLHEVTKPTLVIVGDRDQPDILEAGDFITKSIRGARKAVISNTAHLPNMEQPQTFNQTVRHFLRDSL